MITLALAQGELVVFGDVTIDGDVNGDDTPDITVRWRRRLPVFHIYSGTATLNGLAIPGGYSGYGGGVAVGSSSGTDRLRHHLQFDHLGQLCRLRRWHLRRSRQLAHAHQSTVHNNHAYIRRRHRQCRHADGHQLDLVGELANITGDANSGGGLYNVGSATLIDSTISGNGGGNAGGGIYNTGELTLINTTLSNNSAENGGGIDNARVAAAARRRPVQLHVVRQFR